MNRNDWQNVLQDFLFKQNSPLWCSSQPLRTPPCRTAGNTLLKKPKFSKCVSGVVILTVLLLNSLQAFRITSITTILTKHGFKLDQAADEVVKVNHLILCVPGYQNLVQSVVQFKTYARRQQKQKKGSHFSSMRVCTVNKCGNDNQENHTRRLHSKTHLIWAHGPWLVKVKLSKNDLEDGDRNVNRSTENLSVHNVPLTLLLFYSFLPATFGSCSRESGTPPALNGHCHLSGKHRVKACNYTQAITSMLNIGCFCLFLKKKM